MKIRTPHRVAALLAALVWPAASFAKAPAGVLTCNVNLDREVLPAGSVQKAIVKITLDAPKAPRTAERPPVNLVIVLDRSGSMSGDKIENAKEAAIEALRRLDARDLFSLVIYDEQVETIVPAQSARNLEWIEGRIREIRPGGSTALFGGVSQGAAEIRKNLDGPYIHRIILLSDGIANVGPNSPSDLARLGASLLKERISVTTVGVGRDFNEDLMTQLAQNSDGNTYFVETSDDLPRIFAAELGDVLSVVARDVVIEIECPEGTRPLRIIGRDGRIRGNQVELRLNQLYGGQQKYALVEVEVPAGRANDVREIALARCSYDNALTQNRESASGRAQARFSGSEEEVKKSANMDVQTEFIKNIAAEAKDDAVNLWDQGRRDEAVQRLRAGYSDADKLVVEYNLPAAAAMPARSLEEDAVELEQEGLDNVKRKEIRSGSYQIRTQQSNK